MELNLAYQEVKSVVNSKGLAWQHYELTTSYLIWAIDGPMTYRCIVWKSGYEGSDVDITQNDIDRTDFETNNKAASNKNILKSVAAPIYQRPEIPAGSTKVSQVGQDTIVGQDDDKYIIPNTKKLTIQRFMSGSSLATGVLASSKVELYYDPNGDGTGMTLIVALYTSSSVSEVSLNEKYTGDGVAAIRARKVNLDVGSREVFYKWEGFFQ